MPAFCILYGYPPRSLPLSAQFFHLQAFYSALVIKTCPTNLQAKLNFNCLFLRPHFSFFLSLHITLLASIYNHCTHPTNHFVHTFASQFKQPAILFMPAIIIFTSQTYFSTNSSSQSFSSPTTSFFLQPRVSAIQQPIQPPVFLFHITTNSASLFFLATISPNQQPPLPTNFHFNHSIKFSYLTPLPPAIFW